MTLKIKNPEADDLAQELARTTGETISQAVINAMRERLERERARQNRPERMVETILRIGRECSVLPLLDDRTADEIIGYDKIGNESKRSSS